MKLAASYQNIELMTPDDAALSFFKSPFAVYDTCGAVDIAYGNFGSMACSPVDFTKIGRWWHKGEEIDLVALNDASKEVLFIECKWKTLSMAESMRNIEKLKKKTGFVMWNKGERTEYYGLVAKRIEGKDVLRKKGFMVFDLDDFISCSGSNFIYHGGGKDLYPES
jgi:hypothetical protein